jgi:hypothetical protein
MGGVPGAKGALAVVVSNAAGGVRAIRMDTGRVNRRSYHPATIKHTGTNDAGGFLVARSPYGVYGDKVEGPWTDGSGDADLLADSGTVALWLEGGSRAPARPRQQGWQQGSGSLMRLRAPGAGAQICLMQQLRALAARCGPMRVPCFAFPS